MTWERTILAATDPVMIDCSTIRLKVWFDQLEYPVIFKASPLDVERHGKELFIRAMAGEYGPIAVQEAL